MWSSGRAATRFKPGPRTSLEPALAEKVEALNAQPFPDSQRHDDEEQVSSQPGARRWRKKRVAESAADMAEVQEAKVSSTTASTSAREEREVLGRIIWMLDRRCVEMSLPSGEVRCFPLPLNVKSGSRAVGAGPDALLVLENGSSRIWHLRLGANTAAVELSAGAEGKRFRSSLGSRLILHGSTLLVTGTPGAGAHTPWLFDLHAKAWSQLPDAPHPILSSAAVSAGDSVTIVGGWSKQRSCHGHTQTLSLRQPYAWKASHRSFVPWRRPGAGCLMPNLGAMVALGWMECQGDVGSREFRMLPRNGATQRARTSSSRLCRLSSLDGSIEEVSAMPFADSFEHNGEIYPVGPNVVCIGRDHIQVYNASSSSWKNWRLPRQLGQDDSSSWVKHCGSWALAWLP
eukprot:TRINITY_DN29073_c0_g1_i3.p1 TRINITY_DN29073_c0_g1~~TRINITY_DN29073_c0_g1_i3.p1  ORF type:complete len:401 (-),score=30.82 TRINITY_DN29073_c0_g1_i3:194-1396(-)